MYPKKLKILETYCIGEIAAGNKVVPFTPRRQPVTIVLPENLVCKDEDILVLRIVGDSMKDARLCDGDFLICRQKFEVSEIKPDTICAVFISSRNEIVAKRVRVNDDETVTLLPANCDYQESTYFTDEIEIHGIAIGGAFYFKK